MADEAANPNEQFAVPRLQINKTQIPDALNPKLLKLKKQAYDLKKATGEKHGRCLEAIAKREGFNTWAALLAAEHKEQNAAPTSPQISRSGYVVQRTVSGSSV